MANQRCQIELLSFVVVCQKGEMKSQVLDTLELERERGITIKAQSVALTYTDDQEYQFNTNRYSRPM